MKIEKQPLENHQVKIIAEFEQEILEGFKRQAARKISRDYKIPGFRPGKAPYEVIRRNFGEEAIEKQAIEIMLDDVYPKVLEESGVKPSGPGSLEKVSSTTPPIFEFVIPLLPEVKLGDYKTIRIPYEPQTVSEKEVQEVLNNLRNGYATVVPVERSAQNGDMVSIKIKGLIQNPEDGEDPEIVKEMPYQVKLGDKEEETENWPFEGFQETLIDLSKGDEKSVTHQYTEDTRFSRFAKKTIEFQFSVDGVKQMEYPEMDDTFAKSVGEYQTMDELQRSIHENLEKSKQDEYNAQYTTQIIDLIKEKSAINYSSNTLEDEISSVFDSVKQDLSNQNLDIETYLKFRNKDQKTFIEEEIKPAAIRRLERSLILDETAHAEGIEIDKQELETGVTQTMSQLFNSPGFTKPRSSQDMRKLTNFVSFDTASRILNEKIVKRLIAIAKGVADAEKDTAETTTGDAPQAVAVVEPEIKSEEIAISPEPAVVKPKRKKKTEPTKDSQ